MRTTPPPKKSNERFPKGCPRTIRWILLDVECLTLFQSKRVLQYYKKGSTVRCARDFNQSCFGRHGQTGERMPLKDTNTISVTLRPLEGVYV